MQGKETSQEHTMKANTLWFSSYFFCVNGVLQNLLCSSVSSRYGQALWYSDAISFVWELQEQFAGKLAPSAIGGDLFAEKLSLRMRFRLQRTLLNQQKIRFSFLFLTFILRSEFKSEFISRVCFQFGPRLFSVVCHVVCH